MPFIKSEPFKREEICNHPEHNPPTMLYQEPGIYTYQCPACGKTITYTVPLVIY